MKDIKPDVFRAYDIRGVVDKDFDPQWVRTLGRAVGTYLMSRDLSRAAVGRDCRHSSPGYLEAMAQGLAESGVDVVVLGMVPTPVFYYAVAGLELWGGVMVTASHNPPEFNGFKVWAGRTTLHTTEITKIYDIMASGEFVSGAGLISEHDITPTYIARLAEAEPLARPLKIVLDGGNGAGGPTCAALLRAAGAEVVELFCEPDGDFPNHHPDPVVEANMGALKAAVPRHGADFGVGLDGDGDRLGVVDETGALMFGDRLLAIYARDLLASRPGATVMGEVKCSHLLYRDIEAHGGVPVMGVTGHSVMKDRMIELDAPLAGEMSGHMFFADRYLGFDDAPYAALRLAGIVSRARRPLSRFLDDWPETASTPELRMDCPDAVKFDIVDRALGHFRERYASDPDVEVIDVDGVRLALPDGWALLRASNTQPALVLRFEAETPERLAAIRALVEEPLERWIAEA